MRKGLLERGEEKTVQDLFRAVWGGVRSAWRNVGNRDGWSVWVGGGGGRKGPASGGWGGCQKVYLLWKGEKKAGAQRGGWVGGVKGDARVIVG